MHQYNIKSLNDSSAKYGPCEVCGKHVTEVYYQTEERWFKSDTGRHEGWTRHNCRDIFGHHDCLQEQRKH